MEKQPDKIKRFFLMLIGWVVAVTAIIGGSFIYTAYQGSQYEASAVPYIKQVIPVLSEWDAKATRELMAAETVADIPEENFAKAMNLFSKLGTLEEAGEPEFVELVEDERDPNAIRTLLTYTVKTRFSEGYATYTIQLIDRGDHFQVFNFNLSSETLTGKVQQ